MYWLKNSLCLLFATGLVMAAAPTAQADEETDLFERAPWSASFGVGRINFEGDQLVEDSANLVLRLGYDLDVHWALEGVLGYAPTLSARTFPPSEAGRDPLQGDIWGARLGLDLLYHLRNTKNLRFDPYLAAGPALAIWEEDLGNGKTELVGAVGGGLFYHFSDQLAARADIRVDVVGASTDFNFSWDVGLAWRWGAYVPPAYSVSGGEIDSDGDGLLDSQETQIGTDPYDPDTDKDGLSDGEEVNVQHTDPLDPDTDLDALKDGAEVLTYGTDPLNRDTDAGGVTDGHEVIEDDTDPLDPNDDLQLYTLNIEFDYDKAVLREEDYGELDVVVKVLRRDPGATARIEGHADKRPTSKRDYNIRLSERRAEAVKNYLIDVGGIDASRLTSKGYGFDRPVAPNDTEANMQKNRRTEIYIRPSGDLSRPDAADMDASSAGYEPLKSVEEVIPAEDDAIPSYIK